jgi:anti-anti-sigma factor
MEITKQLRGETVELKIEGRVDGYWADHLAAVVDQEIRQGSHNIQLDLSQVAFLSSAGIGTLVRLYKDLKSIQGSFAVSNCSRTVLKVLQLSKLEDILVAKVAGVPSTTDARPVEAPVASRKIERPEAIYEVYALTPEAKLECQRIGEPGPLETCGFDKVHCRTLQFSDSTFAIGLGALGDDFEDCKRRFGEFIAAAGAVAYLPTDGTNVPDFLLAHGASTPEVQVCYGVACHGANQQPFRTLVRFEAKGGVPITLTSLLESCLELAQSEQIGIVMIAEAAGLIGAALRRSPIKAAAGQSPLEFPRIRDWLSFTAEPAYANRVALVAGIAVRGRSDSLARLIRPFPTTSGAPLAGHFHAAAFSYRPVQRGQIDLKASVKTLFEGQALEGILHLFTDDRAISGGRESEFLRGACWIAPISTTAAEGASA